MPRYNEENLTAKEQAFCDYYIESHKAVESYLKAYPGCKETTAKNQAWQALKRPRVKAYMAKLQKEAFERAMITPERIALELAEIAFAEKGDADYNATAKLKAIDLIQKQFGLQQQNIKAKIEPTTINVDIVEDDNVR